MHAWIISGDAGQLFVAGLLLCLAQSPVHAWGPKGHRIVGLMARDLLSPTARTAVKQLMRSDDLATFALYLDQLKDDLDRWIPGSREWHYKVNLAQIKKWVEESAQRANDVEYGPLWPNQACKVDLEQTRIALSEDYVQQTGPVVEEQLAKAGYRLAALLNRALGS